MNGMDEMDGGGPPFYGKYRGIVTDNDDPNGLGRIRVKVQDVLGDQESGWALPALPYAGDGVGLYLIPPVNAFVWVEFEHGEPDYPIWTGCFWLSQSTVPGEASGPDIKLLKTDVATITIQAARLVWGKELYFDGTKVAANASLDSLKPRFYVEAHLDSLFGQAHEETAHSPEQGIGQEESASSAAGEQEERQAPLLLPTSLSPQAHEELSQQNAARHDWIEQLGAQDRQQTSRGYQRVADLQVSTTDPDATLMLTKNGADLGYHTHFVVDGGKARIILNVLVTPSEVMDNQPMLDLLWCTRFRWKLRPRQVTGDKKYGTENNIVAIEDQGIRTHIPLPDMDHRTEFFSADRFRYEAERDIYVCPAGKELHFDRAHSTERSRRYRARAKDCNHCPLKARCTTSKQGRSLCRSVDEACLDRVRAYQSTGAYKKALRKRQVWVEPLFAEAKDWHGMRRFRLRRLWRINCEALRIAAGLNLKRLLKKRGWGRRPFPAEALCAFFLASFWWFTCTSLEYVSVSLVIGSDYSMSKRKCITFS